MFWPVRSKAERRACETWQRFDQNSHSDGAGLFWHGLLGFVPEGFVARSLREFVACPSPRVDHCWRTPVALPRED